MASKVQAMHNTVNLNTYDIAGALFEPGDSFRDSQIGAQEALNRVTRRINDILYHTPQYRSFNSRQSTIEGALATLEKILTEDYRDTIQNETAALQKVYVLEEERNTVRAFFGVADAE